MDQGKTSEIFVYLGFSTDTFFFIHEVHDKKKYSDDIPIQIYNCMINETMILDKKQTVCVYDVYDDGKVKVIITEHEKRKAIYYKDDLSEVLKELLRAKRDKVTLVFEYIYDKNCYMTYEIPVKFPEMDNLQKVNVNKIIYSLSLKPIEYLDKD